MNEFVKIEQVAHELLLSAHDSMAQFYPDLKPDSKEYERKLRDILLGATGGLFYGGKQANH